MVDARIRTKKIVRYLHNKAGGIENARFVEQDAHDFMQAYKKNIISSGDVQTLINHFIQLQAETVASFILSNCKPLIFNSYFSIITLLFSVLVVFLYIL